MWQLVFLVVWWGHVLPNAQSLSALDRQNLLTPPWSQQNPVGFMQPGYLPPPESGDSIERVMKQEKRRETHLLTLAVILSVAGGGVFYLLTRWRPQHTREQEEHYVDLGRTESADRWRR